MTNDEIEKEIQEKRKTAPRVTPTDLDKEIAAIYTFSADAAASPSPIHESLRLLTIAVVVMRNGFTVVGKSACASPENFDAEIGAKIAIADAKMQIWPLMGYALRNQLADAACKVPCP